MIVKKKILFVLHFPPPVHGAALVGQQIKNSKKINHSFEGKFINLGTSISIDEIGKNAIVKIVRYLLLIWNVFISLILFKPDLCYFSPATKGFGFYKDAAVIFLAKIFRVKLVFHFHNKGVNTRQGYFIDNLLYNLVFNKSDVILLSKYLYPDIQKYVPENRVFLCPNGIPEIVANLESVISPSNLTVQNPEIVQILFLSNLIESKGIFILLHACKILQKKKLNFHCTFVGNTGDVSEQQFVSSVNGLELNTCVHYGGKKYGAEKEKTLANADIFVHPTYEDCFPIVLLEAMQFSLPVVSTFEGGIPEIVVDGITGFLVPVKNIVALAEKLEELILNPQLRQQMGNAGRKLYEEKFTQEHFNNRLHEILSTILEKN